jgi:hypothetical protein
MRLSLVEVYEQNARACLREAQRTFEPRCRAQFIKWAREWTDAAARERRETAHPPSIPKKHHDKERAPVVVWVRAPQTKRAR